MNKNELKHLNSLLRYSIEQYHSYSMWLLKSKYTLPRKFAILGYYKDGVDAVMKDIQKALHADKNMQENTCKQTQKTNSD